MLEESSQKIRIVVSVVKKEKFDFFPSLYCLIIKMPLTFKKSKINFPERVAEKVAERVVTVPQEFDDSGDWESVFETKDGCALWVRDFQLSESDVNELWSAPLVEKPPTVVMGRPCRMRRNVGFFSDESEGYKYTNQMAKSQPLTDVMKRLLSRVNKLCGEEFNGLLFNLYVDGNDNIGAHRDNESNLSPVGVVALSLGAGRKFRVRSYPAGQILIDHVTGNQELMWMRGANFHKKLTHEVPMEKKIKEPRLSITFRKHLS